MNGKAVMFSGQGAQMVGMGAKLYAQSAVARTLYDEANAILGWDLKAVSFDGPDAKLKETRHCQPALFVHGLATYLILREHGVLHPLVACLGLSLGEITALTAAGAFTFSVGLEVVAKRAALMHAACEASAGSMLCIVGAQKEQVEAFCRRHELDIANYNAPGQIVIAGPRAQLHALVKDVPREMQCANVVPLNVAGAYHSRLMEPARAEFATYLRTVDIRYPDAPVFTNTTGKLMFDPDEIRTALTAQIVSPVRWTDCLANAVELGATIFVECGSGRVLSGLLKRNNPTWQVENYTEEQALQAASPGPSVISS